MIKYHNGWKGVKDLKNNIYKVINDFMKYYWQCVDNGEEPLSFYDWLWEFTVNIDDDDYYDIKDREDDCDYIEDELQKLLANMNESSQFIEEIESILSDLEAYKKQKEREM